jgi:hypothetical protein
LVQGGGDLEALREHMATKGPGLPHDPAGRICRKA